jgi:ribose transport system ATP-binding protein
MTVAQSTSLASVDDIKKNGFLSQKKEHQLANRFITSLKIKTPSVSQIVENQSGGNQQKVVLAKWLATNPKVLLLDEPTRGIDINSKNEIYQLINELAKSGLAIIVASSELAEILAIADRILVLAQGKITGEFIQREATEEKLIKAAIK